MFSFRIEGSTFVFKLNIYICLTDNDRGLNVGCLAEELKIKHAMKFIFNLAKAG